MAQKWSKNSPQKGPKKASKWVKTTSKRAPNDANTMPKWSQSDPKITLNRHQTCPKSSQMTLFWSQNGPKKCQRRPVKRPQKMRKWSKMVQRPDWHVQACEICLGSYFFLNIDIVNKSEGFFSRLLKAGHLPCVPCELSPPEKCPGVSITRKMQIVIVFSLSLRTTLHPRK